MATANLTVYEYVRGDYWALETDSYTDGAGNVNIFNITGDQTPQLLAPNELIIDGLGFRYVDTAVSKPIISPRVITRLTTTTHYLTDRKVAETTTYQHYAPIGIPLYIGPGDAFIQIVLSAVGAFNIISVSAWGRLIKREPLEVNVKSVRFFPRAPSKEPI